MSYKSTNNYNIEDIAKEIKKFNPNVKVATIKPVYDKLSSSRILTGVRLSKLKLPDYLELVNLNTVKIKKTNNFIVFKDIKQYDSKTITLYYNDGSKKDVENIKMDLKQVSVYKEAKLNAMIKAMNTPKTKKYQ